LPDEKPTTAYVLSLIGGIFVVIGGLITAVIGAILTFAFAGIGGFFGILGIIWGILIIVFAVRLNSDPGSHTSSGALILIFSILSWLGGIGGLFIGFLLGLIGGILAIAWNPSTATPAASGVQAQPPITRICPNCGRVLAEDAKFCPHCGKALP
jgi:hypothetical protein